MFGFEKISVGGAHACALRQGRVTCWGSDDYGQATLPDKEMAFTDVACGTHHTCAVQKNGQFFVSMLRF
jgi:alpha-tubulin suppressor-like RCC1 family protein